MDALCRIICSPWMPCVESHAVHGCLVWNHMQLMDNLCGIICSPWIPRVESYAAHGYLAWNHMQPMDTLCGITCSPWIPCAESYEARGYLVWNFEFLNEMAFSMFYNWFFKIQFLQHKSLSGDVCTHPLKVNTVLSTRFSIKKTLTITFWGWVSEKWLPTYFP